MMDFFAMDNYCAIIIEGRITKAVQFQSKLETAPPGNYLEDVEKIKRERKRG